jgi:LPS sulfotransferase NodH
MCKPSKSYIIWTSQRTGSTYLCKCLLNTDVAGNPDEWLNTYPDHPNALFQKYSVNSPYELQKTVNNR